MMDVQQKVLGNQNQLWLASYFLQQCIVLL